MKVAIAGAGNVGQFIANDLAMAGHEVLILEQDPGVVSRSSPALSGPRGDGGSIEWRTADACEVTSGRPPQDADCFFKASEEMFLDVWNGKHTPSAKDFLTGSIKSNNPMLLKDFVAVFNK